MYYFYRNDKDSKKESKTEKQENKESPAAEQSSNSTKPVSEVVLDGETKDEENEVQETDITSDNMDLDDRE